MTDIDLEELKRLLDAATAGPWSARHVSGSNFAVQQFDIRGMLGDRPHVYPIFNRDISAIDGQTVCVSPADAALIALTPTLARRVLELAAEVERMARLEAAACVRLAQYNAHLQAVEAKLREIALTVEQTATIDHTHCVPALKRVREIIG